MCRVSYPVVKQCSRSVASFPGPAQLSVAFNTVLKATESWVGPGNEASRSVCVPSIGVQSDVGCANFATGSSSTISGTLRLAAVAIGLIASQWYLAPLRLV